MTARLFIYELSHRTCVRPLSCGTAKKVRDCPTPSFTSLLKMRINYDRWHFRAAHVLGREGDHAYKLGWRDR